MNRYRKPRLAIAIAAIVILGTGIAFLKHSSKAPLEAAATLPAVTYRPAVQRSIFDSQDYTGRLEAVDVVDVRSRVPGTLLKVHFKDGQHVHQGDLLFTIDPAPYQAQVQQAQANLAAVEQRHRLAVIEQARGRKLMDANAIARREVDTLDNAAREMAALLKGARAALATAQLQLDYSQVRAPISGRISRAEITAGNVVVAGGDALPLTRIVSDEKLYASFNVDEQSYIQLIAPSLRAGSQPTIKVGLAGDSAFPYPATIDSVDNQMDTRSGTVRIRARIDQVSPEMLPGLQARVRLQGGVSYKAVVVDDALVGTDQDRKYVLVVDAENKVEQRYVELGALQGTQRVLRSGVAAGSKVIVDGAYHAPPGSKVSAVVDESAPVTASAVAGVQP